MNWPFWIGHEQYRYSRLYNLQDTASAVLNCMLLFVGLLHVYPLRFLFTFLVNGCNSRVRLGTGVLENMIEPRQLPNGALQLDPYEILAIRISIGAAMFQGVTAAISLALLPFGGRRMNAISGITYPILLDLASRSITLYQVVEEQPGPVRHMPRRISNCCADHHLGDSHRCCNYLRLNALLPPATAEYRYRITR